jgi:hypothetical protein
MQRKTFLYFKNVSNSSNYSSESESTRARFAAEGAGLSVAARLLPAVAIGAAELASATIVSAK